MFTKKQLYLALFIFIFIVLGFIITPPLAQPLTYHLFADTRAFLNTPNFADVWSNLPFCIVGLWAGIKMICTRRHLLYHDAPELIAWIIFALGVFLVGFGSAYYHLDPNNATLLWDRLPMSIAFMALTYAIITDHMKLKSLTLLISLVLIGMSSVVYWHYTEQIGAGDLRPYALVQFLPIILLPILVMTTPSKYTKTPLIIIGFGWYVLAKLLEHFDIKIFKFLNGLVSGHTLKHLASAVGAYVIMRYFFMREKKITN